MGGRFPPKTIIRREVGVMKKLLLTVLAMLVAVGVFASGMFPDVPEKHWAYGYVKHLKEKGIVIGYPDGTFKGDRNITRYEEAAMISRLIGLIETEIVGPYISDVLKVLDAISMKLGSTIQRVDALEKKLAQIASSEQLAKLESALKELQSTHEEQINYVLDAIDSVNKQLSELRDGLFSVKEDVSGELEAVKKGQADQASKLSELSKSLESLKQTVNIHDKDVIKLYEAIANLQKKHDEELAKLSASFDAKLGSSVANLQAAISKLEGKIAEIDKRLLSVEPLKNVVKDLTVYTRNVANRVDEIETQVGDLSSKLDRALRNISSLSAKVNWLSDKVENIENRVSLNEQAIVDLRAKIAANEQSFNAFKLETEEKFSATTKSIQDTKSELLKRIEELSKANAALTGAVIGAIILAVAAMIVGAM